MSILTPETAESSTGFCLPLQLSQRQVGTKTLNTDKAHRDGEKPESLELRLSGL